MSSDLHQLLKESLEAIERLEERLAAQEREKREPIAVIGVGCRYPGGVENLEQLWAVARDGVDAVGEVPSARWDVERYYDPDPTVPGKMITRRGGFLKQPLDEFDAQLFGISPREAAMLDPQQRLLLETAWEAMERAGIASDKLAGSRTGVFVGMTTDDYGKIMSRRPIEQYDMYAGTGTTLNAASGRISFTFGFQGPCLTVDTACSSSLVAVHLACHSLRERESDLALAGGVNIVLLPEPMILFSKWGMMAPDGACKTFDQSADGFVRAEGCAMIALKRLSDAVAANDPILAVIRGSASNSDGRSSGLTVPNGPAQQAVIRTALADAGLGPEDIDYVEAHGTGTPIGDPIELEALASVLSSGHSAERPLWIGAFKSSIGHTEAASGVAGLLKVVSALQHQTIPPQLHFSVPNQRLPWSELPLAVATEGRPWPATRGVRRAGVSAFGFSGTNAHVILEEAPTPPPPPVERSGPAVVAFSGRDAAALRELAGRLVRALAERPELTLNDVALTLTTGRAQLAQRLALVASSKVELADKLEQFASGEQVPGVFSGGARPGERPKIAFLFTGQGAQYAGMGRGLYDTEPVFRGVLDRAAQILEPFLAQPLTSVLFPEPGAASPIGETAYTQPALFALEYALAELWRSWGVTPSVVIGHSVGEYVAACVAGAMNWEDGLRLIAERGRLMQALPAGGAMAAIFAAEERVQEAIRPYANRLSIAGLNGPEETVISGEREALLAVLGELETKGVRCRSLEVSHAFHSALLEPMLDELERKASAVATSPPRLSLISNLTGAVFAPNTKPDGAYWRKHAREAVRFAAGVDALKRAGVTAIVEIGPHPTLSGLVARIAPGAEWTTAPSLRRGKDDRAEIGAALCALYARGASIDWDGVQSNGGGRRVPLPTYPFQRSRFWADAPVERASARARGEHPLLGELQPSPKAGATFVSELSASSPAFLADHVILDNVLLPGTAYVELALAAARARSGPGTYAITDFAIEAPLSFVGDASHLVHTALEPEPGGRMAVSVHSAQNTGTEIGDWRRHAKGTVKKLGSDALSEISAPSVADAEQRCSQQMSVAEYYARLEKLGLRYGPAFRGLKQLALGTNEVTGTIESPVGASSREPWVLHPAQLDSVFLLLGALLGASRAPGSPERVYLPVGMGEIRVSGQVPPRVRATARLRDGDGNSESVSADIRIEDEQGRPVATLSGLEIRAVTAETLRRVVTESGTAAQCLGVGWVSVPGATPASISGRRLLILADRGGFGAALAIAITQKGGKAALVERELSVGELGKELGAEADGAWVVDCRAVDRPVTTDAALESRSGYVRLLKTLQALAGEAPRASFCLVTRGAQAVGSGEDVVLSGAPLIGLARTATAERAHASGLRLDLDPSIPLDPGLLVDALAGSYPDEPELAVRRGGAWAPRLSQLAKPLDVRERRVLRIRKRGDLEGLSLEREPRRVPGPGEVELAVRSSGLNFRDVLNVLGMIPNATVLGSECSGVVVAVGPDVERFRVGDEVVGFAVDSLATHAIANVSTLVEKPQNLGFAAAATIPNTYMTAALSLFDAARVQPGQTVLIHAAAGGVGLAALRLMRRAGVNVIATAGSREKRELVLREGASHAFDSRSVAFEADVMRVTGGAGVDAVLNALTGELIAAGMRATKQGGAFIEIGKQGIWTEAEARERAPGVHYAIVDLGTVMTQDPERIRVRLEQTLRDVASGELGSLPVRAYPLDDALSAFRLMAAGRHVGKLVIEPVLAEASMSQPVFRGDGTYLVTGGLGGLGLATAEWLIAEGAGRILLVGRRPPDAEQAARIAELGKNARVEAVACDVGDAAAVERLWTDVVAAGPPLRGIFHCAGVLADAPINEQSEEGYDRVARAKIDAALRLHERSSRDALDWFVLYSSSSALFGSPGQANYAASNAFLDALSALRRAHGLPALSVNWGAWGEAGMAARLSDEHKSRFSRFGVGFLSSADAFRHLGEALVAAPTEVAILSLDKTLFAAQASHAARALFGIRAPAAAAPEASQNQLSALRESLGKSPEERLPHVLDYTRAETARVLGLKPASLDVETPLSTLGFDSLMAVQLRNRVATELAVDLPLAELLRGPTVSKLGTLLASRLGQTPDPAGAPQAAGASDQVAYEEGSL